MQYLRSCFVILVKSNNKLIVHIPTLCLRIKQSTASYRKLNFPYDAVLYYEHLFVHCYHPEDKPFFTIYSPQLLEYDIRSKIISADYIRRIRIISEIIY